MWSKLFGLKGVRNKIVFIISILLIGFLVGWILFGIGYWLFYSHNIIDSYLTDIKLFLGVYLVLLTLVIFVNIKILRKQKIRNRPSWVAFIYSGLSISPLCFIYIYSHIYGGNRLFFLSGVILCIGCYFIYLKISPSDISYKETQFPPGTVGLQYDNLGFKDKAKKIASEISKAQGNISVIQVDGGLGEGKSSFSRMVIECMDYKKTLFTYISLTETNKSDDLNKLFYERWVKTIDSRYPKISNCSSINGAISSILRGDDNSLGAFILKIFPTSTPLFSSKKIDKRISEIFEGVTEFDEKRWIILFDEIDRATLDEVYRLIEIIERFKHLNQYILPIKITFILAVSLQELLSTCKESGNTETACIIRKFFENHKNIDIYENVPPVSIRKKEAFIIDKYKSLKGTENIIGLNDLDLDNLPTEYEIKTDNFISDHKEALGFITRKLIRETPRVIEKTFFELYFTLEEISAISDENIRYNVRLADILGFSFMKVKYPSLVTFIKNTINNIRPSFQEYDIDNIFNHGNWSNFKNVGEIIKNYIKDFPDKDIPETTELINFINSGYRDRIINAQKETIEYNDDYIKSLHYWYNLWVFIYGGEKNESYFRTASLFRELYNDKNIGDITYADLYNLSDYYFAQRITFIEKIDVFILFKIINSAKDKEISINDADSLADQFTRHIINLIREKKKIKEFIKEFLTSDKFSFCSKFSLIDILIKKGIKDEILDKYITDTFDHFYEKYINNKENIFNHENNFIFALNQWWSGDADNLSEINNIREIINRDIKGNIKGISVLLSRIPDNPAMGGLDWEDVKNLSLFLDPESLLKYAIEIEDNLSLKEKKKIETLRILVNNQEFQKAISIRGEETIKNRWLGIFNKTIFRNSLLISADINRIPYNQAIFTPSYKVIIGAFKFVSNTDNIMLNQISVVASGEGYISGSIESIGIYAGDAISPLSNFVSRDTDNDDHNRDVFNFYKDDFINAISFQKNASKTLIIKANISQNSQAEKISICIKDNKEKMTFISASTGHIFSIDSVFGKDDYSISVEDYSETGNFKLSKKIISIKKKL